MTDQDSKRVVVIGSSFAGMTGALQLRKLLDKKHEVVVLDPRDHFTFIPSLIWLPFGARKAEDVTFKLEPMYSKKGIRFINEAAAAIDPDAHTVTSASGEEIAYDRLLVATGPRLAFERVPGLGPEGGYTESICNLDHAEQAAKGWQEFLENPGPVVVGTAQGGSCFGASYEFLFNVKHRIRKAGLEKEAPVTFVSAEPYLGHFGLAGVGDSSGMVGKFFDKNDIEGLPNTVIKEVRDREMDLESGRTLPFAYSMIVPPFGGVDVVTSTPGLANDAGFIPVDSFFRSTNLPEVFSAGVSIAVAPPEKTQVPAGVPKTGQMSETMAKVAAENIVADLEGRARWEMPMDELAAICVLDAGNNGIIFKAEHVLDKTKDPDAHIIAGPQAHWAKLAFERIFLSSRKRGHVVL
ncbi:MAG: NAD(P)/FAD-dependent oxidoreductase [Solirubrobacterales bacterium]|nr:NAD(P)/FAD-dependent oxidoreductase [Solirubrobacterales bacterium]